MAAEYNADDTVCFFVEAIVAAFVLYEEQDEEAGGNTYGQSGDVNGSKCLISPEVAECNPEIVFEHS